jgi:hypothetical protein
MKFVSMRATSTSASRLAHRRLTKSDPTINQLFD